MNLKLCGIAILVGTLSSQAYAKEVKVLRIPASEVESFGILDDKLERRNTTSGGLPYVNVRAESHSEVITKTRDVASTLKAKGFTIINSFCEDEPGVGGNIGAYSFCTLSFTR